MKKEIRTSNLAMRFYFRDGWTREELEEIMTQGELVAMDKDREDGYYVLAVGGRFDVEKLLEKVSRIRKTFDDYPNETDKECIERFNW